MEHHDASESSPVEYLKFILVLLVVLAGAFGLYSIDGDSVEDFIRYFMGSFMVVFASFKFIGYRMFVEMFPMYDPIAKRSRLYSQAYPFIEFSLGALALANLFEVMRLSLVILLMGVGALGIIHTVYVQKKKIHCACLGNIIKLPLSTVSLAEDVGMVALAVFMLIS